jgi:hypothetical protein
VHTLYCQYSIKSEPPLVKILDFFSEIVKVLTQVAVRMKYEESHTSAKVDTTGVTQQQAMLVTEETKA